jgi:hypothetical protein|tara:strand:- start:159 stop:413 length:255 start_codon:yes stop_codon:yes gene_type:complete
LLEQKVTFIMKTLSLTAQKNGKAESRSLLRLFEEFQKHDGTTATTLKEVAERSFAKPDPAQSTHTTSGPDGFSGEETEPAIGPV